MEQLVHLHWWPASLTLNESTKTPHQVMTSYLSSLLLDYLYEYRTIIHYYMRTWVAKFRPPRGQYSLFCLLFSVLHVLS
jgi:hypothetical protein